MRAPRLNLAASRATRFAQRFGAHRGGAGALEFGMIVFPFFFMMFCVLELALVFVVDSALENAMIETSRLVRTGQAHTEGMTADSFKAEVCERMTIFAGQCPGRINIDVRVLPQFGGQDPPEPSAGSFPSEYDQGAAEDIILIRAWYSQPLVTPFLEQGLSRFGDGKAVLTATSAFRNEPF